MAKTLRTKVLTREHRAQLEEQRVTKRRKLAMSKGAAQPLADAFRARARTLDPSYIGFKVELPEPLTEEQLVGLTEHFADLDNISLLVLTAPELRYAYVVKANRGIEVRRERMTEYAIPEVHEGRLQVWHCPQLRAKFLIDTGALAPEPFNLA